MTLSWVSLQLCSGLGNAALQAVLSVCVASLQIISLYTLWQLVHMHEMDGHRFNRYQELGQVRRGVCFGTLSCVSGCTQVCTGF